MPKKTISFYIEADLLKELDDYRQGLFFQGSRSDVIIVAIKQFLYAVEALQEYQRFNRVRNDLDAYLYAYGEWALGESDKKPNPEDYGINA